MRRLLAALALAGALVAVQPGPADAEPFVVVAVASKYAPAEVVIPQGSRLTFVNADNMAHDVTADLGEFDSDQIGLGEKTEVRGVSSLEPNTYSFYCTVHPDDMWGLLTVV